MIHKAKTPKQYFNNPCLCGADEPDPHAASVTHWPDVTCPECLRLKNSPHPRFRSLRFNQHQKAETKKESIWQY